MWRRITFHHDSLTNDWGAAYRICHTALFGWSLIFIFLKLLFYHKEGLEKRRRSYKAAGREP